MIFSTLKHFLNAKTLLVAVVFLLAISFRLTLFSKNAKDELTYKRAVSDLVAGINPYDKTIESYKTDEDTGDHGYAYLPGLLYIYTAAYSIHFLSDIPVKYLLKIPILICDLVIGIYIFKKVSKTNYLMGLIGLILWFFNPYMLIQQNYTFTEPVALIFLLLAIGYHNKETVLSGATFALAVVFKTLPAMVYPAFFLRQSFKDKKVFVVAAILVSLAFALPFFESVDDFLKMLNGSLFVHGSRAVQGRPFLFYISYYLGIELIQTLPIKLYSMWAFFGGFVISFVLYKMKVTSLYVNTALVFLNFYIFNPVFNRSYVLWILPFYIIGASELFKNKKWLYYTSLFLYFGFFYWYLNQWTDGFQITKPHKIFNF